MRTYTTTSNRWSHTSRMFVPERSRVSSRTVASFGLVLQHSTTWNASPIHCRVWIVVTQFVTTRFDKHAGLKERRVDKRGGRYLAEPSHQPKAWHRSVLRKRRKEKEFPNFPTFSVDPCFSIVFVIRLFCLDNFATTSFW